jgi:hypothetical protein
MWVSEKYSLHFDRCWPSLTMFSSSALASSGSERTSIHNAPQRQRWVNCEPHRAMRTPVGPPRLPADRLPTGSLCLSFERRQAGSRSSHVGQDRPKIGKPKAGLIDSAQFNISKF